MNIFRIFFVSTVLIPVLVVVATSDDSGVIIRRPTRSIVISEDGTRSARRHQPVNISDRNCPALGCTGNLTSDTFNGKGSVAATILPASTTETFGNEREPQIKCSKATSSSTGRSCKRIGSSTKTPHPAPVYKRKSSVVPVVPGLSLDEEDRFDTAKPYHPGPLKLEIKAIKNSTRTDAIADVNNLVANEGNGRALFTTAILLSWVVAWTWKAFWSFIVVHGVDFLWTTIKNKLGYGNDSFETTITLGNEHGHGHHGGQGQGHGQGWASSYGHQGHGPHGWSSKGVHRPFNRWHHPASHLFQQPTYQYLPHGKEYQLLGFDQKEALKYRQKYDKKFEKYKTKHNRHKYKAKKKYDKAKRRAQRRKNKADRREKRRNNRHKFWSNFGRPKDEDESEEESWDEPAADIGEGSHSHSSPIRRRRPLYRIKPIDDYDPLPSANKNQHFLRISG
ncbi:unnamed protein product [Orchesella dallaii]|uniref:Uncharacterized protein n=1 Tax=Orchesella dallaii TaxID=48710 RepID=A0ABP1Q9B6_9HEXA